MFFSSLCVDDTMWWQFCSHYGKTEQFCLVILECWWRVVLPVWFCCSSSRPPHFICCLPFSASRVYTHFTHSKSFHNHILIVSTLLERISVLLWLFFNVFSAFPCLFITFGKFIHVKEHTCGDRRVVLSLFRAIDSFNLKNLHVFMQVTHC